MYRILDKSELAARVHRYVVHAPDIARKARAGQFVILRLDERGERIPITIADMDSAGGTLTLYVQVVGKTTLQMSLMGAGDAIRDVVGPLGVPSVVEPVGTVVSVGGGFGIAALYPILRQHQRVGNRTISILGARSRGLFILEDEIRAVSHETNFATDDGSYGTPGLVTDVLAQLLQGGRVLNQVIAIGPLRMMQAVSEMTRPSGIKTLVSMNPMMMDGTGMCGACRVTVGGETRFACVDGPEFDGHQVDFDTVANRLQMYLPEERLAMANFRQQHEHTHGTARHSSKISV
jgi:NAD(P)H-flavin reductase